MIVRIRSPSAGVRTCRGEVDPPREEVKMLFLYRPRQTWLPMPLAMARTMPSVRMSPALNALTRQLPS